MMLRLSLVLAVLTSFFQADAQAFVSQVKINRLPSPVSAVGAKLLQTRSFSSSVVSGTVAAANPTNAIATELTLQKSQILGKTFLYGSSLQFSSMIDKGISTSLMALAIGHVPAQFQIVGRQLQLVADRRMNFESDVNHPGRLIHNFPILSETADSLVIRVNKASPLLASVMGDAKSPAARTSWLRSVEFVPEGSYLLLESSIEGADGSIGEFLEAIFPRDTLVPADAKPLYADASIEPLADRFRLLGAEEAFMDVPDQGRVKTKVASRFLLKDGQKIRFYITANVPDAYLNDIKTSIEGWNRYSQDMWNKDFIEFAGKLPAGVKIGDPRYNIVVWDTVQLAGAAYESQAADPFTGIQSHSLIYLPLAWVNIGKAYWDNGQFTETALESAVSRTSHIMRTHTFMNHALPAHCMDNPLEHINLLARQTPEQFSHELLKGVLFHEVGHSLGLDHNFKASMSYDSMSPSPVFSTSIMDYNQYNIERAAFSSVESSGGPMLEYDRQIISALYNNAADIKETDAILPACNDEESDSLEGGVDPLCIRYDAGQDPSVQAARILSLLKDKDAFVGTQQSLPKALEIVFGLNAADATAVSSLDDAAKTVSGLAKGVAGAVSLYTGSTANSAGYAVSTNVRMLRSYQPGVLPDSFNEKELRARAAANIRAVLAMTSLPEASATALNAVEFKAKEWLRTTPAVQAVDEADREAKLTELTAALKGLVAKMEAPKATAPLAKMRTRIFTAMTRSASAPFHLEWTEQGVIDQENFVIDALETGVLGKINSALRAPEERLAAVKSLHSFLDTTPGFAAIQRVLAALDDEGLRAPSAGAREVARALKAELAKPAAEEKEEE